MTARPPTPSRRFPTTATMDAWCHARLPAASVTPVAPSDAAAAVRAHAADEVREGQCRRLPRMRGRGAGELDFAHPPRVRSAS